jgi:PAS domain-containing protein
LQPNATGTMELRYLRKDGQYVWIEITLVNLLDDPAIQGLLGNYHDITERKKAEKALTEKNAELQAVNLVLLGEKTFNEGLLECLPGYLYVYNDKGDLVRWNKKHETMTGFTGEELSRKNMSD